MTKKIHTFTLILIASTLFSCVQVEPVKKSMKENIAISSVRDSDKVFPQGSRFSIEPKYTEKQSISSEKEQETYKLYQAILLENLQRNGFVYKPESEPVDFIVGFGLALSTDVSDEKLNIKFGLTPGLAEQADLNKGSFIVYIKDAHSKAMIWRGAVQGFAHEEISQLERATRSKAIVNQVMTLYYQGK